MAAGKIGLMLLVERGLAHPDIWFDFLRGHADRYRIFTLCKYPEQISTPWLRPTLIAEYVKTHHSAHFPHTGLMIGQTALLRAGLADLECVKFLFLSETCVPIRRFEYFYSELTKDDRSWIGHGRWPERYAMLAPWTPIHPDQFGTSVNWLALNRQHAGILVDMEPTWMKHFESVLAADEHYPATMLALNGVDFAAECHPHVPTHVDWNRGGPYHGPYRYERLTENDVQQLIRAPYLLARKFPPASDIGDHLDRIMAEGEEYQVSNQSASHGTTSGAD